MIERPHVADAPGVTWRLRKGGWQARWQARRDLVARGFEPRAMIIWIGTELTDADRAMISTKCTDLQRSMLGWAGGAEAVQLVSFDGTLSGLIRCYRTDPDSTYHKLRYHVRRNYDYKLKRLDAKLGDKTMAEFKGRMFNRWYDEWAAPDKTDGRPKLDMAHAMISMLRTVFNFGATIIEDPDCERIGRLLHGLRFKKGKQREEALSSAQADLLRPLAHSMGFPHVALAQSFQYDGILRQKDVIGEWVPIDEPGASDVHAANEKWLCGIRWSEIDANLIFRHVTSKKQKPVQIDLKLAPMVVEELNLAYPGAVTVDPITKAVMVRRDLLPAAGPLIVCASTGLPYRAVVFRDHWRKVARACGIPDNVYNMDSRAGGITEATDAGAELEHVRHAATHSDIKMTQKYSRGNEGKVRNVQLKRAEFRNKGGTK